MHPGARICEGELHRLDLRVQLGLETLIEGERKEGGNALAIWWELADIDAPEATNQRLDPLRPMLREVVHGQPARLGDRGCDLAAVQRVGTFGCDPRERCSELGKGIPLAGVRRRERRQVGDAPLVSDTRTACQPGQSEVGGRLDGCIEAKPSETLSKVGPKTNRPRDCDGARSRARRRLTSELGGRTT